MSYLTSFLLTSGIICICYGIYNSDRIIFLIGAICLGAYNGIYNYKIWRK